MAPEAILIFDVGKTNKKLLVFDARYQLLAEESVHLAETVDEDGFPCENVAALTQWIRESFQKISNRKDFSIRAVNFSAYGASFVCVDEDIRPVMALSNYLKPYPTKLQEELYERYGGKSLFSKICASPPLGSLNAGLQLYRLRQEKPGMLRKVRWALHLPQYVSSILSGKAYSEMTSIGCHTCLWDFPKQKYHQWVSDNGLESILAPIVPYDTVDSTDIDKKEFLIGVGMHDSSAALLPYLATISEPFILLSTGTWNICLNPFNQTPLTEGELNQDCLCYLSFEGKRVKASRLFAGHEHGAKVKELCAKFNIDEKFFLSLELDIHGNLNSRESAAIAYLDFMKELVNKQVVALGLVRGPEKIHRIFVDGGFSKNGIFMTLLAQRYPLSQVFAASIPQASALGAALAIHRHWNSELIPENMINLRKVNIK